MPIRRVVLFNIGPAFGGFRFAAAPGRYGLDHPAAFAALEQSIATAFSLMSEHQPSEWRTLAATGFEAALPRLGDQEGVLDCSAGEEGEGVLGVVLRASLPFARWPLGGWVVYDARYRAADGSWSPFTPDELAKLW